MTLPFPPRKALLRSLWLVSNFVGALILGFIAAAVAGPVWIVPVAGLILVLVVVGLRLEELHLKLHSVWNRAAGRIRKAGFRWTLYVSHHLLLRAVGPEGSRFDGGIDRSAMTGWTPYAGTFDRGGPESASGPIVEVTTTGWWRQYLEWARDAGNRWALLLFPFLILLAFFREDAGSGSAPSNIYTLF